MPAGSTITYVVTGTVISTATGTISNTASVTPPFGSSQMATDTDNLSTLSITKSDDAGGSSPNTVGSVVTGQTLTYTFVVSNTGPGDVIGATITNPMPPSNFTLTSWTAASTGSQHGHRLCGERHDPDRSNGGQLAGQQRDHVHDHRYGQFDGRGRIDALEYGHGHLWQHDRYRHRHRQLAQSDADQDR